MFFPPVLVALAMLLPPQEGGRVGPDPAEGKMVGVPAGSYLPHYSRDRLPVAIPAFEIDRFPVTREEYLSFVTARPEWRRSAVKPLFAAEGYLKDWSDDLDFGDSAGADAPVAYVSWFAANSFCEWQGKRLPTTDEWEYLASASETRRDATDDPRFLQRVLELRAQQGAGLPVGSGFPNVYGVWDLHGAVSEWVLDFNSGVVPDDSRAAGGENDRMLYCAAAGVAATNPSNYAAFLRFAMRSGLDGRSTQRTLGFRCARSI